MKLEEIDTRTLAGKIEVMRLAEAGRAVAFKMPSLTGWAPATSPCWDWGNYDYAIVAEPMAPAEIHVVMENGFIVTTAAEKQHADNYVQHRGGTVVRYVRAD